MTLYLEPEISDNCCCAPMVEVKNTCPPKSAKQNEKYIHEVGAEMIGNQLIIRMEKDKKKSNNRKKNWTPPCDCDVIEIKRPTSTEGPKIVNGGNNNQILFRIHSKTHMTKKEDPNYKPQAIAYKINRLGVDSDRSRKITVYPHLGGPDSQEVYTDHITEDNHDVYLLRIKKKTDEPEKVVKRNLEVELRTPKLPELAEELENECENNKLKLNGDSKLPSGSIEGLIENSCIQEDEAIGRLKNNGINPINGKKKPKRKSVNRKKINGKKCAS